MILLHFQSLSLGYVSIYTVVLVRLFYRSELLLICVSVSFEYQVAVVKTEDRP